MQPLTLAFPPHPTLSEGSLFGLGYRPMRDAGGAGAGREAPLCRRFRLSSTNTLVRAGTR